MRIAGTIDATGEADMAFAIRTLSAVAERYSAMGLPLAASITLVVENIPIMGATEPNGGGYRLHVASFAIRSGMLDGLIAHEMGHMIRMERHHPSHDPALHGRVLSTIRIPPSVRRGFLEVARGLINHVEDIYADDLSFEIIGGSRAEVFFSDWIDRSSFVDRDAWQTIDNEVSIAFALGNMQRHDIVPVQDVGRRVNEFAKKAGLRSLNLMTSAFRDLPKTDDAVLIESTLQNLALVVRDEGVRRAGKERGLAVSER